MGHQRGTIIKDRAPYNPLFINKINQKGHKGHDYYQFTCIYLSNHDLLSADDIDSLGGGLGGKATAAEVVPGS